MSEVGVLKRCCGDVFSTIMGRPSIFNLSEFFGRTLDAGNVFSVHDASLSFNGKCEEV